MLIGKGRGAGSANIHATVPGKVLRMMSYTASDGQSNEAFVIRMEGSFEKLGKRQPAFLWENMLSFDIQRIIAEYGIVEMDGAGRPVSDIIASLRSVAPPITLVVRCIFDDPWLAADYALCQQRLDDIAEGAAIIASASRVDRIVYVFSEREAEMGEAILSAGSKWGISNHLVLSSGRYPQHNRRELELILRDYGKREEIVLGSLFILGPATLAAVYDAVKMRKPILERYVAVGGTAVRQPQVMKVRIGTRIGELFAQCGGFSAPPKRIASGSPLLGKRTIDLDEPVIKTTGAVFALRKEFRQDYAGNCINCGECRKVCPVGLDPEELYKRISMETASLETESSLSTSCPLAKELHRVAECHGCGCCEAVCPSQLPLSTAIVNFAAAVSSSQSGARGK